MIKASVKIGDTFSTNDGGIVKIVEYKNYNDVTVEFLDDSKHRKVTTVGNLKNGKVKNPYKRSVHGVGFIGEGLYKSKIKGKVPVVYSRWRHMLSRCYCEKTLVKNPSYIGCSVCEEWHNFQNFAEWFYQQPNHDKEGFELDKDLRIIGNKIYSPEACSFVPKFINGILNDNISIRGEYHQGVRKHRGGKYEAYISFEGNMKYLGLYETSLEAFCIYEKEKENYLKNQADKYKACLNREVYDNLKNWRFDSRMEMNQTGEILEMDGFETDELNSLLWDE